MRRAKPKTRPRATERARIKARKKAKALAQETKAARARRDELEAIAKRNREAESEYEQYASEQKLSRGKPSKYGFVFVAEITDTTCHECEDLNGTQWAADDPDIPQLPIHPHCNCRLEPVRMGYEDEEDY